MSPATQPLASFAQTRRAICTVCLRPQSTCICQWIVPTAHVVEVLILQHPLEVANAKGSARLLHWSLPHSRLVTGEVFAEQDLQAWLSGPLQAPGVGPDAACPAENPAMPVGKPPVKRVMLLYPETPDMPETLARPEPSALVSGLSGDPSHWRLVVLDGTWRKSRKMLHCNPLLQQLPRLALRDMPASAYRIRKAHRPDQLSTLEATCAALTQLEGRAEPFAPLLAAFDGFVAQQLGYCTR
jgi:DTW domain-containing protein